MAMAVPSRSRSPVSMSRLQPIATITATALHAIVPRIFVNESSSFWRGERVRSTEVNISAMRPISVDMPVAVTTITPVPLVTDVFWKSIEVRSPRSASSLAIADAPLGIGALSPVREAS